MRSTVPPTVTVVVIKKRKVGHPRWTGTNFPPTPWIVHASYISDSGKFPVFYATKVFVTAYTKACQGPYREVTP
jgi:hypothetical protein